jgi:hypothetical protein
MKYSCLLLISLLLCACVSSTPPSRQRHALPTVIEFRSPGIQVENEAQVAKPSRSNSQHALAQFEQHIVAQSAIPARIGPFTVKYLTHNRYLGLTIPAVPENVPDELEIWRDGQILIKETIPSHYKKIDSTIEIATIQVGNETYLLSVAQAFHERPMWLALHKQDGELLYRGSLQNPPYTLLQQADGIRALDQSGTGKRWILINAHLKANQNETNH